MSSPSPETHHKVALAVFFVVMIHSLIAMAPTTYLLDSPELIATSYGLGVSHPPGHPAYGILGHLIGYLPIGSFATRAHLFSALAGAGAASLIPWTAGRMGWTRRPITLGLFALLGVAVGISDAFAIQSIRAEVYALHVFIAALALALGLTPDVDARPRALRLAALALGVGLLNHHYLTLFVLPAMAAGMLFWDRPVARAARTLVAGAGIAAVTLLGYASLWASGRAQHTPTWLWPKGGDDIFWVVSGAAFQKTAENALHMDPVAGTLAAIGVLSEQLLGGGLVLALVGGALLLWRQPRVAVVLGIAVSLNLATQILFAFDPMNPDVLGYFMLSVWIMGLLIGYALHLGVEWLGAREDTQRVAWTPAVIAVGLVIAADVQRVVPDRARDLRGVWDSEHLRDAALMQLEPDGIFVTSYFETAFNTWYGQGPEDRRPDVTHIHRAFRTYETLDEIVIAAHPDVADVFDAPPLEAGLNLEALLAHAARSEVLLEADRLNTVDEAYHAVSTGLYLRVVPESSPGPLPLGLVAHADAAYAAVAGRLSEDLQTRRNLLWANYNLAEQLCVAGHWGQCQAAAERALELAPDDPDVMALAARIRASVPHASP